MKTSLDIEADAIVARMLMIGAEFFISPAGRGTAPTWFYAAAPSMRHQLRRYRASIDMDRPGFCEAMVKAIGRVQNAEVR